MAEIFEVSNDCATAVEAVLAEAKYEPRYPKLKNVICQIGGASVGYLIDGILTAAAPTPVKFPVMAAKITQKIGIMVLSAMAAKKAAEFLGEEYDKDEQIIIEANDKIRKTLKEDETDEETASE